MVVNNIKPVGYGVYMIIEHIIDEDRICDLIDDAYRLAKIKQANSILIRNILNSKNTFAIYFFKKDENGNEKITYMGDTLLEISDINIFYRAIYTYKKINKNSKSDISIEVWYDKYTTYSLWL